MIRTLQFLVAALLCLGVAACGRLPAGAPASNELLKEVQEDENGEFALYLVSRAFLPTVQHWPETGQRERLSWIGRSQGPKTQIIQPGDALTLQVWDSSENSLLTAREQRVVPLERVRVAANGTIFVPYVGDVRVSGLTPAVAREKLQSDLEVIVPSVQVQLSMEEGRANSVELVGGVAQPGTYPMPDRNYTVRSLLSAGGGVSPALKNPQIRLVRGSAIYGTSVDKLLATPGFDTLLRGGDQVYVEEDARYFLSLGATGTEALHPFTREDMSAMDALAVVGGVNDSRADPKGLLILREYPASAVAPGERGPRNTRVVFSIDLTTFDGLFSARKFQINPNDLVLATEAPINDVLTVSNVIGRFFGIFGSLGSL
jgi:polysaccharide export outer membrane protein